MSPLDSIVCHDPEGVSHSSHWVEQVDEASFSIHHLRTYLIRYGSLWTATFKKSTADFPSPKLVALLRLNVKYYCWILTNNEEHIYKKNVIFCFYFLTVTLMWSRRAVRKSLRTRRSCLKLEQPAVIELQSKF